MKKTIKDYQLEGKKVIIRCDLNVPMHNNTITDDTRIKASLKTIQYALDNQAKVIILSHLGKIKEEKDKQGQSLYPVSKRLQELLGLPVKFSPVTRGKSLDDQVASLQNGEVLVIENTRFEDVNGKKESNCDAELSKYWASLGDIFINDAYGTCHRAHASNVGIAKLLPNAIGFLVEEELTKIEGFLNETTHPFIIIMGGKKVSDKIGVIKNLLPQCDKLIIGGAMAYTFLQAQGYNIGASLVEEDYLPYCQELLTKWSSKIILPQDSLASTSLENPQFHVRTNEEFSPNEIGYDIGPMTIQEYLSQLEGAQRVIINGPMGVFEDTKYQEGTRAIYNYLAENHIKTLVGGGDSAASVNQLGFVNQFYHISTGGGATLEYLEGKELPGISVIQDEK